MKLKLIRNLEAIAHLSAAITVGVFIAEFDFGAAGLGVFVGFTAFLYLLQSHYEMKALETQKGSSNPIGAALAQEMGLDLSKLDKLDRE